MPEPCHRIPHLGTGPCILLHIREQTTLQVLLVGPSLLHSHLREAITLFIELQQVNAGVLVHKELTGKRTRCGKKLKNDICNMYTDEKKGLFFHLQRNKGLPLH